MTESSEGRTMRRNIRELPRPAWFLVIGNLVNWFASFAVVFLVLYLTDRGFSVARAGAAVAAYGLGELVAGGLAGYMADRLGRRTTMAISFFTGAATIMLLYFVETYAAIVVVAFLAGLATEIWRPASRALMSDLVPEGQRVTAFALVRFSGNLGLAIGAALAGFLAARSFLWVFVMDAATSVIFGLIAVSVLPEGRRTEREEEGERGGYRSVLADRSYLLFLAGAMLIAFIAAQGQTTLPLHVVDVAGLTTKAFGLMLALNGFLIVILELPISSLTMRRPPREMIATGFLLVGLGFALTASAHSLTALLGTVVIWTFGEMIAAPVAFAYVADIAPEHLRGRYQGLFGVLWGTGSITGPAVGALLFARSPTGLWLACGLLGLGAALFALLTRPAAPVPAMEAALVAPPGVAVPAPGQVD